MIYLKRSAVSMVLLALFIYLIIGGTGMMIQARLFTLAVGIAGVVVVGAQLVRELLATTREIRQQRANTGEPGASADVDDDDDAGGATDFAITKGELTRSGRMAALEQFTWLWGLIASLWLLGFYVAVPTMVALYLLRYRERLLLIAPLSAGIWLAVWGVFDNFLNLPFPPGQLWLWFGF